MIAADKKPQAEIVLRDLIEIEGKILRVDDDSFVLEPKKKNDGLSIRIKVISIGNYPKKRVNIKYTDVLQIVGKQATRSFVPDPKLTSYSEWNSLASIGVGALLQVHTMDGKKIHGVSTTWSDNGIRLMRGNTETEISKDDIVRVYQLAGDTKIMATKIFKEGRKIGTVADAVLRIMSAAVYFGPAAVIGVAAAGAAAVVLMYVLPKGGIKRVLLYAA
jgi:hypothetical protein